MGLSVSYISREFVGLSFLMGLLDHSYGNSA